MVYRYLRREPADWGNLEQARIARGTTAAVEGIRNGLAEQPLLLMPRRESTLPALDG